MEVKTMREPTDTLTLRLPISLKLRLEIIANKEGRTLNSMANKIIREYFEAQKNKDSK